MTSVAVYIATTGGAVQIERVTPERAPQSLICLGRSSTILPISGDYDDFVRPGSGIIEREFGTHEGTSYRLDLSGAIRSGQSWQLGVFLAHALATTGDPALMGGDAAPDEVVVVTGRVDFDLKVDAVDHIPEKLAGLANLMPNLEGCNVTLIVPAGENHALAARSSLPDGVRLVAAASAWDACRAVGLRVPDDQATALAAPTLAPTAAARAGPVTNRRRRWALATLAVLVAAGALFAVIGARGADAELTTWWRGLSALFADNSPGQAQAVVAPALATLRLLAQRPPAGRTCADVQFGGAAAVLEPVAKDPTGGFLESRLHAVCGLAFEVTTADPARYVSLLLHVQSGKRVRSEPPPPALRGVVPLSGVAAWSIVLPRRSTEPFAYQLTLIEAARPFDAEAETLRQRPPSAAALRDLARKGITVRTIEHIVRD